MQNVNTHKGESIKLTKYFVILIITIVTDTKTVQVKAVSPTVHLKLDQTSSLNTINLVSKKIIQRNT